MGREAEIKIAAPYYLVVTERVDDAGNLRLGLGITEEETGKQYHLEIGRARAAVVLADLLIRFINSTTGTTYYSPADDPDWRWPHRRV